MVVNMDNFRFYFKIIRKEKQVPYFGLDFYFYFEGAAIL